MEMRTTDSFTVLAALMCVVTCILTIITLTKKQELLEPTVEQKFEDICVDCDKLGGKNASSSQVKLLQRLITRTDNGVLKCCAVNSDQLFVLLELAGMVRNNKLKEISGPTRNVNQKFTPVSAHKQLLPSAAFQNRAEPVCNEGHNIPALMSDYSDPLTEHVRGVDLENDSLKFIYPGLYYVYSSTHFRPVTDRSSLKYTHMYVIIINRKKSGGTEQLLQTAHTVCSNCTGNEQTVFNGGNLYLEAGDRIQVCYSSLGLVKFKSVSTFVGLMMIDSDHTSDNVF